MFIGSIALAALQIAEWGLSWYWWSAIGGGLFILSGFAIVWGQQNELNKIKDECPKIETTVRKQHNDFDIEVLNKGEAAEFEAQVEILCGKGFILSLPPNYSTFWRKTINDKTELKKGQRDWLRIASLDLGSTPTPLMRWQLHYYKVAYFEASIIPSSNFVYSTAWIPGNTQTVKPCITLRITISSKPSMTDGALVRTYNLSDRGLSEVNSL